MIKWKYNRYGHVEIWKNSDKTDKESDLYIQIDYDVKAFFEAIGLNVDNIDIDDFDVCNNPGYFE